MQVAVIGCGAIGSPLVMHLKDDPDVTALRIVDPDQIELSNLARQPWFAESDIGQFKAERLRQVNPELIEAYCLALREDNVSSMLEGMDVVFDGTDNWPARQAIQGWSFKSGHPWFFASALGTDGMACMLSPQTQCLYCLFGTLQQGPHCFESGVLGPLTLAVAGQSLMLWESFKKERGRPELWPRALYLLDGQHAGVRSIDMKKVRCSHSTGQPQY